MTDRPLRPKQEAFVREYLVDLNATQAAIRAGYSEKTAAAIGYENLRKPQIAKEVQRLFEERSAKVEVTSDYVLGNLVEISERCLQRAPVMIGQGARRRQKGQAIVDPVTGEVTIAPVWEFDSPGALRANELLGKHLKIFTEKTELSGPNGGPIQLEPVRPREKVLADLLRD